MQAAGIPAKVAAPIGISVDHRRKNRSEEGMAVNVDRLKEYKAKLVVFPRKDNKPKAGDSSTAECAAATQFVGTVMPCTKAAPVVEFAPVPAKGKFGCYEELKNARNAQRHSFRRAKKAEKRAARAAAMANKK